MKKTKPKKRGGDPQSNSPVGIVKSTTKKRTGPGRPRKDNGGRREISVSLAHSLVAELDRYVADLREDTPGASRGDVLSDALRDWPPFIRWGLK